MDIEQFKRSPSGRLAKSGTGREAYWSFVPNPLPPELGYDPGFVASLSEADRALGELAGLGRMLENPHLLIRPFLRREAVASSRIEGTESDLADLYVYEAGQRQLPGFGTSPPESDVREVLNYVHALEYGLARLHELPVSLRSIRELHKRLLAGVRGREARVGEFRRAPNWIGPPGSTIRDATYVPPPAPEMRQCLDGLEKYVHAEPSDPPLVRLALIHYQFEAIHPFLDGNGRIGRLMISLLAVHWNLLPLPLLYMSPFLERHRQEYYEGLLAVSARGAWEAWVRFFLRGVAEQCRDGAVRARRLQDLRGEWRRSFQEARSSGLVLTLIDSLFHTPVLSVRQAQDMLGVTHRAARRNIAKLVEAGILTELGQRARGKLFLAEAVWDALRLPENDLL
jgi:Fic family protein